MESTYLPRTTVQSRGTTLTRDTPMACNLHCQATKTYLTLTQSVLQSMAHNLVTTCTQPSLVAPGVEVTPALPMELPHRTTRITQVSLPWMMMRPTIWTMAPPSTTTSRALIWQISGAVPETSKTTCSVATRITSSIPATAWIQVTATEASTLAADSMDSTDTIENKHNAQAQSFRSPPNEIIRIHWNCPPQNENKKMALITKWRKQSK